MDDYLQRIPAGARVYERGDRVATRSGPETFRFGWATTVLAQAGRTSTVSFSKFKPAAAPYKTDWVHPFSASGAGAAGVIAASAGNPCPGVALRRRQTGFCRAVIVIVPLTTRR